MLDWQVGIFMPIYRFLLSPILQPHVFINVKMKHLLHVEFSPLSAFLLNICIHMISI